MKRVLILADHAFAAHSIRSVLRHTSGLSVVGFVSGRGPCALVVRQARPDVVLIDDLGNPQIITDRVSEVRCATPGAKVVLLAFQMDAEWLAASGVDAVVSRAMQPLSLGMLVREVANGTVFHRFPRTPTPAASSTVHDALTTRELEILDRVTAGASNAAIGRELFVTEQTVKFHLSNVYRKLGVANRTEATHYAFIHGLLQPPIERLAG